MRGLLAPVCVTLLCIGCALRSVESPFGGDLTLERELELSAEIHRQLRAQVPFVSDPVLLAYVNELGQQIVRVTEPQPFIYRFSILESDDLNAFTIGGGYVYLSSAVVAQAGDVAELAGVLAHEIAHVKVRHIARANENQGLATLISLAAAAAVVLAGGDPSLIAIGSGINVSMQLKHSREHEAEADREGIEYMIRSGYQPDGMIRFFQRILTESPHAGEGIPPYLFTHPALRERIAAARVDIKRLHPPWDLIRRDDRLPQIQARLALAVSSVVGGSGLQARASFDRKVSDPLLEQARQESGRGEFRRADQTLARAQKLEPQDPRLVLARADLAQERADLPAARLHLERAFEIDPSVPLVAYRLGLIHKQLANRSSAVFYLEQAVHGFSAHSSGRRRAELAIEQISFPVLDESGIGGRSEDGPSNIFIRGEEVTWSGRISRYFQTYNPELVVNWSDPSGVVVLEDRVRMNPFGHVSSSLRTKDAALGRWKVSVRLGDSLLEEHSFQLRGRRASSNGGF